MNSDWRRSAWRLRYVHGSKLATELRKLGIRLTHQHCRVEFQGPVRLGPGFALDIPDGGSLIVGPGVDFRRGFVCEISANGVVRIGSGTTFTSDSLIQCTTSIDIGPGCNIGQATLIVDGNHQFRDYTKPMVEQGYNYRPIVIGAGASVAAKATIMANVGERAFVGANAVVTRDIPDYCLAVGIPARVAEYYGPPERRPAELDG